MLSGVISEHSTRTPFETTPAIPTQDADAALAFCRALATTLNGVGSMPTSSAVQAGLNHPILSLVIPVCNEQENLDELYARLVRVLNQTEPDYELIFVDDGSRDRSLEILTRMAQSDARVSVITFARNFGHQAAISAGLDQARGNAVIVMDADLQDPPEVLGQFIAKWREGNDVVYAIREQRKEGWFKRTSYAAFYRLLQRVASIEIPLDAGDFCIMDRRVVDLLVSMPERNRFVRGIRSWVGLNQVGLRYERGARHGGETKYSYGKLVTLALDGLVSFSFVPLRIISMIGICVSILSILLAIIYTIQKVFWGLSPPGFPTTIVAIFFLAGIQLITIGVIGEYVGRIFEEVKRRPLYVVRQVIRKT
jgi:dolichol-phosphate mannosyltransferase